MATQRTRKSITSEDYLELLYWTKLARAVDERSLALFNQGKIPGVVFSQLGHEAISVGAGCALQPDDVVAPMHRDLGAYLLRGMAPGRVFAQAMGRIGATPVGDGIQTCMAWAISLWEL